MFKRLPLISFLLSLTSFNLVFAQTDSLRQNSALHDSTQPKAPAEQKDLIDLYHNIIGHKEEKNGKPLSDSVKFHYSVVPAIGYTLSTGFAGAIAANSGFFINDPDKTNESNISGLIVYTQYMQLTIGLQSNIWTKDNKYNIVTDWRYYKYPQDTYGLGGHSADSNVEDIDYSQFRIHQILLRRVYPNIYAGVGYFLDYHWNVKQEGLPDGQESDATKYGLPPTSISSGPVLNVLYDNRKNSINPRGGFYANVLYHPNFTFMGSDNNWQSLVIDLRKYFPFPANSRNILAFWNFYWLTLAGEPPYLDLPSTGWDNYNNTGRGYIQGRFRSANMLYLEAEYRFAISRNGILGGVVFANAQSFSNYYPATNFDNVWPAVGLGIRLKVNKHSDTNIAIDYGFGLNGSRGFFVNLGELF
ncbi:MAG: BamA/TamA family outer membrane protein [Chitinophagales bacterium]